MTLKEVSPILAPQLQKVSGIAHGFFTRDGGVSTGIYKGLNTGLGSNDDPEKVAENRNRIGAHLGVGNDHLVSPYQIHSADAIEITGPWQNERPKADAVVSNTPGVAAAILTADCGPVLFADPNAGVVAAAHAGWQGATGGILESTIAKMSTLGAARKNIIAILGPTISQKNYEVGPEFVARLVELDPENAKWMKPSEKPNHAMFSLTGYIVERLEKNGVEAHWTGNCTYDDESRFYSYRRKTHRGEGDYGRQLSAICLR